MPEAASPNDADKAVIVATTPNDEATCRIIVDGKVIVERTSLKVAACLDKMPKGSRS